VTDARGARRAVLAAAAALLAGCGGLAESPERALHRRFGAALPPAARVVAHWRSGAGLDHAAVWEVAPADEALLRDLVQGAARHPPGAPALSGLVSERWPAWWRPERVERLPEAYGRDRGDAHWRVWVDRAGDRLYLQWFTT
jgi:hypothetical protein